MHTPQPIFCNTRSFLGCGRPLFGRANPQFCLSLDFGSLRLGRAHSLTGALDVLANALQQLLNAVLLLLRLRFCFARMSGRSSHSVDQAGPILE